MVHGKRVSRRRSRVRAGTRRWAPIHGAASIRLSNADDYEGKLLKTACHRRLAARKSEIDKQLQVEAKRQKASLGEYRTFWTKSPPWSEFRQFMLALRCSFLEVPHECLISPCARIRSISDVRPRRKLLPNSHRLHLRVD